MATLAELRTAVQARGYGTDTATAQTEFIRAALRRIYGMRRWRFLEDSDATVSTVAGTPTVALPSGTREVDSVRLADAAGTLDLEWVPEQRLLTWEAEDGVTGPPEAWTRQGDLIRFWPTPDKAYTVEMERIIRPTLPSADSDTVTFPDEWTDVIVAWAASRMATRQRDWPAANEFRQEYRDHLAEMVAALGTDQRQNPARVENWRGWAEAER